VNWSPEQREQILDFYVTQYGWSQETAEEAVQELEKATTNVLPRREWPKVANTQQIVELNNTARERGYNRTLDDEFIKQLEPQGWHMCDFELLHEFKAGEPTEPHIRGRWLFRKSDMATSDEPTFAFIDMDIDQYTSLPQWDAEKKEIVNQS
jgi:hypothetical protein